MQGRLKLHIGGGGPTPQALWFDHPLGPNPQKQFWGPRGWLNHPLGPRGWLGHPHTAGLGAAKPPQWPRGWSGHPKRPIYICGFGAFGGGWTTPLGHGVARPPLDWLYGGGRAIPLGQGGGSITPQGQTLKKKLRVWPYRVVRPPLHSLSLSFLILFLFLDLILKINILMGQNGAF